MRPCVYATAASTAGFAAKRTRATTRRPGSRSMRRARPRKECVERKHRRPRRRRCLPYRAGPAERGGRESGKPARERRTSACRVFSLFNPAMPSARPAGSPAEAPAGSPYPARVGRNGRSPRTGRHGAHEADSEKRQLLAVMLSNHCTILLFLKHFHESNEKHAPKVAPQTVDCHRHLRIERHAATPQSTDDSIRSAWTRTAVS